MNESPFSHLQLVSMTTVAVSSDLHERLALSLIASGQARTWTEARLIAARQMFEDILSPKKVLEGENLHVPEIWTQAGARYRWSTRAPINTDVRFSGIDRDFLRDLPENLPVITTSIEIAENRHAHGTLEIRVIDHRPKPRKAAK